MTEQPTDDDALDFEEVRTRPFTAILGELNRGKTDPYAVQARFRYRIVDGALKLGYRMVRPDKVRRAAFVDITTRIADGCGLPVLAGTPRQ